MLSQHPANRVLRGVLLAVSLISLAQLIWARTEGTTQPDLMRYLITLGLPLLLGLTWLVFTSPDEPDAQRKPLVPIPGGVRMALETSTFLIAIWALLVLGRWAAALAIAIGVFLHYSWSAERIVRLLRRQN